MGAGVCGATGQNVQRLVGQANIIASGYVTPLHQITEVLSVLERRQMRYHVTTPNARVYFSFALVL